MYTPVLTVNSGLIRIELLLVYPFHCIKYQYIFCACFYLFLLFVIYLWRSSAS